MSVPSHLPFLRFEDSPGSKIAFSLADQRLFAEQVAKLEAIMASIALIGGVGGGVGAGELRVAVVAELPVERAIFSGGERVADQLLAEILAETANLPFAPQDILFLVAGHQLEGLDDKGALHLGIHNISALIASMAPTKGRDTLYLAACISALLSLNLPRDDYFQQTEEFLNMWVGNKLGDNGPVPWNDQAIRRVEAIDPWAARFMIGLGLALPQMRLPKLLTPLWALAETARTLQATATLGYIDAWGTA